jgi:hypothetical protein
MVLAFNLLSADTAQFDIDITALDSGAGLDTYEFTFWVNGAATGTTYTFVYTFGIGTVGISYTTSLTPSTFTVVPGDHLNVQIQNITLPGALTNPTNLPNTATQFVVVSGAGPIPCFPRSTPILTHQGYRPVETLTNEDTVRTTDGRDVHIKLLNFTVKKADQTTAPYRISAGALGHYYPPEDICLSAIHAIQDSRGVWQMPKYLARHNPMVQQYGLGESVEYFHIECPNFFTDNLVVGGATVESFKNRQGAHGAVYVWNKDLNGFVRNERDQIKAVPKNPGTIMVWG